MALADPVTKGWDSEKLFDKTHDYLDSIGQLEKVPGFDRLRDSIGARVKSDQDPDHETMERITGEYPVEIDLSLIDIEIPGYITSSLNDEIRKFNSEMRKREDEKGESRHLFVSTAAGDTDYVYLHERDEQGKPLPGPGKRYKKIGKFLKGKSENTLQHYKNWKGKVGNIKKLAESEDVKLVISTNPADIMRKSTGQFWTSCETMGTGFSKGIWQDIEEHNAIAYLTIDGNAAWKGRVMLRRCIIPPDIDDARELEGGEPDIGIESVFYGDSALKTNVQKIIGDIAAKEGLLDYEVCLTDYDYEGWSDQMSGPDRQIIYGDKERVDSLGIEGQIDEAAEYWDGKAGFIQITSDAAYGIDEIEAQYRVESDLGRAIRYELGEYYAYVEDSAEEGLPQNWEEGILQGYPVEADLDPEKSLKEILEMDLTMSCQLDFQEEEFPLWNAWTSEKLLREVFRIVREHGLDMVYFEKPPDNVWGEEKFVPKFEEDDKAHADIASGMWNVTNRVSQECLDDDKCFMLAETWAGKHPKKASMNILPDSPFQYDSLAFYRNYATHIARFYQCVVHGEGTEDEFDADINDWKRYLAALEVAKNRGEAVNRADHENVVRCFAETIQKIGYVDTSETYDERKIKFSDRTVNFIGGGIFPLDAMFEDPPAFIRKHPDINIDTICTDPGIKGHKHIEGFCKIERPIEKFWTEAVEDE